MVRMHYLLAGILSRENKSAEAIEHLRLYLKSGDTAYRADTERGLAALGGN